MGIRLRLLIAFAPLLILVLVFAVILPVIQGSLEDALAIQTEATLDLVELQQLTVSMLRMNQAYHHLGEGELDQLEEALKHNQTARSILDRRLPVDSGVDDVDPALDNLHRTLSDLYAPIIAAAQAGDTAMVQALFARDEERIDAIVEEFTIIAEQSATMAEQKLSTAIEQVRVAELADTVLVALLFAAGLLAFLGLAWLLVNQVIRPIERLAADANKYAAGDHGGQLSNAGSIKQVHTLRDAFQRLLDTTVARQERLQATLNEREEQIRREAQLRDTVEALSLPVVPLAADALLLPLIGHLDEARHADLTRRLLQVISERRTRRVALDLSGLAEVTSATAALLLNTAAAARLLGAEVTLIGVRPDQASILADYDLQQAGVKVARDIPAYLAGELRMWN